jgi:hypothetical protein
VTGRRPEGAINDVAVLDPTPMTSAEELAGITRISDVAIVLVPEALLPAVVASPWTTWPWWSRCPTGCRSAPTPGRW